MFFGSPNFGLYSGEGTTQISDRILQIWVTIEHVAKFGDDRTSDHGSRLIERRKKKERGFKLYSGETEWPAASIASY